MTDAAFNTAVARGVTGFQRDCRRAGVAPRYDADGRVVLTPKDLRALINVAPDDRRSVYRAMLHDPFGTGACLPDGVPQRPS
jgi:hypothetical protein